MHVDVVSFYLFSCFGRFHGFLFWLKKRNKETNISDMEIKISPFCLKKNDLCTLPFPSDHCLNSAPICLTTIWCSVIFLFFRVFAVFLGWFFFEPPQKKMSQPTKVGQKKMCAVFFQFLPGDSTIKGTQQNKKLPFFELLKQRFHDWVGETFPHCLCLGPKLGKFCKSWRVVYIMEEYFTVYS